jgi:hypothetical protein
MARKIRARTLAQILTQYLGSFPLEAAGEASACDPAEGAELLTLLLRDDAWTLLQCLDAPAAAQWLAGSDEPALRRLLTGTKPTGLLRIWPEADPALRARVLALLDADTAAALQLGR